MLIGTWPSQASIDWAVMHVQPGWAQRGLPAPEKVVFCHGKRPWCGSRGEKRTVQQRQQPWMCAIRVDIPQLPRAVGEVGKCIIR